MSHQAIVDALEVLSQALNEAAHYDEQWAIEGFTDRVLGTSRDATNYYEPGSIGRAYRAGFHCDGRAVEKIFGVLDLEHLRKAP